ncbi:MULTISPECIES: PIN domain nuclease [Streptomyces]|uniref:PIN domain nuclease n=1 Tax=Streptomyces TaxID=1883 RepID=UPI000A425B57|nr:MULTISPECIES: PIN domain nuclease [Streptomyces]MDH6227081.1 putative nucleic acid-binding protein [Streptomyces sp. MJP52]
MTSRFLIDKSALARYGRPAVRATLRPLHERGLLAVCGAVEMEVLYSARDAAEATRLRTWLRGFDRLSTHDEVWDRALEVQGAAIAQGNHRAFSMADLLIAAVAERHGAVVLHYDGDYDMIAKITGQPTEWAAAPGTAD